MSRKTIVAVLSVLFLWQVGTQTAHAAPDLIVSDISLSPTSPIAGSGTISVTFRNIGPDDVDLSIIEFTNYCVYLDGSQCHCSFIFDLAAGATDLITTTACNPATSGSHSIRAVIDSDFDVAEANEGNNERTESFVWRDAAGGTCTTAASCTSGFCVDGVCCESACGGGVDDCQVCSVAEGGTVDGTCGPLTVSAAAALTCRPSAGDCDVPEVCSASSIACPTNSFAATSTVCRGASGACDLAESCTGTSAVCPSDAFEPTSTVCRTADGSCDVAETCTGASGACPADQAASDGTSCDDGAVCNGIDACMAGECVVAATVDCDDSNPCTADSCAEPSGCAHDPIAGCTFDRDAGVSADAGATGSDAGPVGVDAAVSADASIATGDTGTPGPTAARRDGGCAAATSGEVTSPPLVLLLLVVLGLRRRRGWRQGS